MFMQHSAVLTLNLEAEEERKDKTQEWECAVVDAVVAGVVDGG